MGMKLGRFASLRPSVRRLARGLRWLEQGEPVKAFSIFASLAKRGNVEAQYQVGQAYLGGRGVPPSLEEGTRWIYRAAQAGLPKACFTLATVYAIGLPEGFDPGSSFQSVESLSVPVMDAAPRRPDFDQAAIWARKGAEAGHADAQALYAHVLTHGPSHLQDAEQARHWYRKAADGGAAQGHLGLGLILIGEASTDEQRKEASLYLHKAADGGLGTACATLGWMYETGFAVGRDLSQAAKYYEKAAEHGVAPAQARYGLMLLKGVGAEKNVTRAETWLRRAAGNDDSDAAALLGDLYMRGEDFIAHPEEALKWYRLAAEGGHVAATRALALLYLTGTGTEADPQKAAQWFQIAAARGDRHADADFGNLILAGVTQSPEDQAALKERFHNLAESGDPLGAFNLGVCLAQGVGGDRDKAKALYWMGRARDGIVNAQYWYGRMLIEGGDVEADPVQGFAWIEKAAEAGMMEARVAVAQFLITGQIEGHRDHPRALELYHQAADQGSIDALFSLGAMYGGGHDVPMDRTKAFQYFQKAAQRGHGLSQLMVGRYLVRGLAGRMDPEEGRLWLERAAARDVSEAREELEELNNTTSSETS